MYTCCFGFIPRSGIEFSIYDPCSVSDIYVKSVIPYKFEKWCQRDDKNLLHTMVYGCYNILGQIIGGVHISIILPVTFAIHKCLFSEVHKLYRGKFD